MTTATSRRPAGTPPLLPLKEHPLLVALCAIIGLVLGLGVAAITPATYTAETRLAVGTGELSNLNIPGYPTASADMAANYARWVTSTGAGGEVVTDGSDVELTASPLPGSNVIRVEAKSGDPDLATTTVDAAATALRDEVNKVRDEDDPEQILAQIEENAPAVVLAQEQRNVAADAYRGAYARVVAGEITEADTQVLADQLSAAEAEYERLDAAQGALIARYQRLVSQNTSEADLTIVQPGEVTANDKSSNFQRFGLVGLVGGAAIGFVAAHLAHRRGRRRR